MDQQKTLQSLQPVKPPNNQSIDAHENQWKQSYARIGLWFIFNILYIVYVWGSLNCLSLKTTRQGYWKHMLYIQQLQLMPLVLIDREGEVYSITVQYISCSGSATPSTKPVVPIKSVCASKRNDSWPLFGRTVRENLPPQFSPPTHTLTLVFS